ncbi:MAG TPA: site-2 protease family protein, partial [Candidatus Deferrimicrobiaceae bacterium]
QEIVRQKMGPVSAFLRAGKETGKLVELTVLTVVKLLTRTLPSDTLGGPILIAQLAGDQARQGVSPFAYFLGLLSVNLGILNLLPIPILDGGHILFFSIEALRRKPLSPHARALAQQVGLAIILMLTALVFYNDIARIVAR